tara:strand:+ start:5512 stop:6744 length:1233 start_codon:yes stop_codon:yes gene_type:complete
MKDLFIDCPTGVSGNMLLSAFFDLGFPKQLFYEYINSLCLPNEFELDITQSNSYGIKGVDYILKSPNYKFEYQNWPDIKRFILQTSLDDYIKEKVLMVFTLLAEAESNVHGCNLEKVHFHELSSLRTLINIVGVCSAFQYFKPNKVYCTPPPAGSGNVETSHGIIPIPVPVVLEIAKKKNIPLLGGDRFPYGELTTPTGIALISIFAEAFHQPEYLEISSIGIGLGSNNLGRPNLVRVCQLNSSTFRELNKSKVEYIWQDLISQEAWIDDSSGEDLASLIKELRDAGAIDVSSHCVQMKKNRQGVNIKTIVKPELANKLRLIWFSKSTTIGLRESSLGRWILPRRNGTCMTRYGEIKVKQVKRINGIITSKVENYDLERISQETGRSIEDIRTELLILLDNFQSEEEWHF